jgi:hypothetical protein
VKIKVINRRFAVEGLKKWEPGDEFDQSGEFDLEVPTGYVVHNLSVGIVPQMSDATDAAADSPAKPKGQFVRVSAVLVPAEYQGVEHLPLLEA